MRHGFLLIDKPLGPTSHDAVSMVRRALAEKQAGHVGTLDPAATGLLVVAVGAKALKVVEFFVGMPKSYEVTVTLGKVSTTYDGDGMVEEFPLKPGWLIPAQEDIRRIILDRFVGKIRQRPPAHSAIKIGGKRAYEMARKGEDVDMPEREVEIKRCEISEYKYPLLKLSVECGSGTYMRSLAHDLGEMLRCGGYMSALRRTTVGHWHVKDGVHPDKATWTKVLPLKEVLKDMPAIELTDVEATDIGFGRKIKRQVEPDTFAWHQGLPIAVLVPAKEGAGWAQPRKVL